MLILKIIVLRLIILKLIILKLKFWGLQFLNFVDFNTCFDNKNKYKNCIVGYFNAILNCTGKVKNCNTGFKKVAGIEGLNVADTG